MVAQLIGVATLIGFVFTLSFVRQPDAIDVIIGQRVSARRRNSKASTFPEMGALGYPEFELKARTPWAVQ